MKVIHYGVLPYIRSFEPTASIPMKSCILYQHPIMPSHPKSLMIIPPPLMSSLLQSLVTNFLTRPLVTTSPNVLPTSIIQNLSVSSWAWFNSLNLTLLRFSCIVGNDNGRVSFPLPSICSSSLSLPLLPPFLPPFHFSSLLLPVLFKMQAGPYVFQAFLEKNC